MVVTTMDEEGLLFVEGLLIGTIEKRLCVC